MYKGQWQEKILNELEQLGGYCKNKSENTTYLKKMNFLGD